MSAPNSGGTRAQRQTRVPGRPTMLSAQGAMRILDLRMGITVGRSTFYRWMQTGRLFSVKMGGKIFVPLSEMETIVDRLSRGERL
jgi:hypothetical protein